MELLISEVTFGGAITTILVIGFCWWGCKRIALFTGASKGEPIGTYLRAIHFTLTS
tara:strand:- start:607 stop:774 length:168 start_codon:yes stop_codon:yes gene_type:complete